MKTEEQRLKYNAYMREYMRKKRESRPGAKPGSPGVYEALSVVIVTLFRPEAVVTATGVNEM